MRDVRSLLRVAVLGWALHVAPAAAASDPALESRVNALAQELRCLVCQNQTIADSNAPLAVDLREQVREQLAAGKTEAEIIDYMVARYGDFVRYRPPVKASTLVLWFAPPLLLLLALVILVRAVRGRSGQPAHELTPEERARAAKLLATREDGQP